MAIRFAVASGDFSNPSTWEIPSIPTASDDVYANGNTISITGSLQVQSLNNGQTPIMLYDPAIPIMTSNTAPAGFVAAASSVAGAGAQAAYLAFDRNLNTYWQSTAVISTLQIQFPVSRSIQRYAIKRYGNSYDPTRWNFEASNNGSTWTVIHGPITSSILNTQDYYSPVLNNTGSFGYYRMNISLNGGQGTTVIASLDMTENTSSVTSSYTNTSGGSFSITSGSAITASFNGGNSSTSYLLTTAFNAPGTASFLGNFAGNGTAVGGTAAVNGLGLLMSGTGRVNWNGNIIGCKTSVASNHAVRITGNATFNLIGNLEGGNAAGVFGQGSCNIGISNSGISTIDITGNVTAGTSIANYGVYNAGAGSTINITGNLLAGSTNSAGNECHAIFNTAANTIINITGTATAVTTAPCIANNIVSSYVNISGPLYNASNGVMALQSARSYVRTTPFTWMFTKLDTTSVGLYSAGASGSAAGLPATTDVRYLTVYGPANELVGSLRVATPDNVRNGVLTDNTTGSAQLTAADFLSAISSSSDPLAVRLRNVATVDTVGGQIAAFTP